jgi:molybdopterin-containing oxidoreductase family membrane subunit
MAEILKGPHTYGTITDKIASSVLRRGAPLGWLVGFGVASAFAGLLALSIGATLLYGIGLWGVNIPVGWGFAIVNFVWWIGIGHAGTLISAILLLLHQAWRTSINRFAEAMTIFAVMCAGLFPLMHMGRPQLAYFLFPYPNTMLLWPQWRSPLVWDVFAVSTYFTVSFLFWYLGLVPDFGTLRDQARHWSAKMAFGFLSLGWRGSARHWHRYEQAYLLLAGLATPLVVSVHTVVSLDFTAAIVPGWHSTIFPPYFVAGAIFSGFAMVLTIAIPLRWAYGLHGFITDRHLQNMGKLMLATGMIVFYGYIMEFFIDFYGHDVFEQYVAHNRMFGPYAWVFWSLVFFNIVSIQPLWSHKVRSNVYALFAIAICVNIGMWLERFMIVVVSLHRDFLTSSWRMYYPTWVDIGMYVGSIGFFVWCMLLFIRFMPVISIAEMRGLLKEEEHWSGEAL